MTAGPAPRGPGPSNTLVLAKIPEGVNDQQLATAAGRYSEVLQISYRAADMDGLGWALIAYASPELAKAARDRLDGKALSNVPGSGSGTLEAAMGEGLYGNLVGICEKDSPWREARTPQGQVYYYHQVTRQSAWAKPPPDFSSQPANPAVPQRPGTAGHQTLPAAQAVQAAQEAIKAAPLAAMAAAQAPSAMGASHNLNAGPVGANLFIYHIPNMWDDSILRQHFEHFGKIVACRVQCDAEGRPRGFGFVSFESPLAAQAAIAGMHGFPVEGKHLKVQLKKGDEQQLAPSSQASMPAPHAPMLGLDFAPLSSIIPPPPGAIGGGPPPVPMNPPPAPGSLPMLHEAPSMVPPPPTMGSLPCLPAMPPPPAVGGCSFGAARTVLPPLLGMPY